MTSHDPISLPEAVVRVVRLIAERANLPPDGIQALRMQLGTAAVLTCKPTMIDLLAPTLAPRVAVPDGPLPVRAVVVNDSEQSVGEILVWFKDGLLTGIEQAWYTDHPPMNWPHPDAVRLR